MITYQVHYKWYKYNTGKGDNGYCYSYVVFDNETRARDYITKVNSDPDARDDLINDEELIGFFCNFTKLVRVDSQEIFLEKQPSFESR